MNYCRAPPPLKELDAAFFAYGLGFLLTDKLLHLQFFFGAFWLTVRAFCLQLRLLYLQLKLLDLQWESASNKHLNEL